MARFFTASLLISILSLHLITAAAQTQQPDLDQYATNNALDTEGGKRFDYAMGIRGALAVLGDSSNFIPNQFHYGQDGVPYKPVRTINFTVEKQLEHGAVALTTVSKSNPREFSVKFNARYSDTYEGIRGVMYHELAHVWQNFGKGTPFGVIEGVADFIRLKDDLGAVPAHWVKPGGGQRWDQGYDVTARFLDYCNGLRGDFVWRMNARLANGAQWSESVFVDLLGKSVHELWKDYKKKYGA